MGMDTKTILIGLVIGLLIGSGIGYGATSGQIYKLEGQVSTLTTEKTALKTEADKVPSLQKQVTDLAGDKATLTNQVTTLQAQLKAAQASALNPSNFTLVAVSFSRTEDTSSLLQYWIGRANQTIRVAVYSFTADPLGDALIAAKNRGVDIEVYIDNKYVSSTGSEYPRLQAAGVPIKADTRSADMHHKFVVIDGKIVATGSYNWSANAEDDNDENLII
jgi:hypothetical protein